MTHLMHPLTTINWENLLSQLGSKALTISLLLLVAFLVKKCLHWLFKKSLNKTKLFTAQDIARQQTLLKLLMSLSSYALGFLTAYAILAILGLPVSSLLAGAGIAGLAIGLGAQGFLTDLINGLFILMERQFDVGDTVVIQGISGKVVNLGIRTTQLKSKDGTIHFFPNRNITYVSNHSRNNRLVQVDLPLAFNSDFNQVTHVLSQVCQNQLQELPDLLEPPRLLGPRKALDGSSVYRVEALVKNGQQEQVYYTCYQLFQEQLKAEGLLD